MIAPATAPAGSDDLNGLDELDAFLLSDAVSDEAMLIDSLDGYLTAIALGPVELALADWLPGIWGPRADDAPRFDDAAGARRVAELILDHLEGIVAELENDPEGFEPLFQTITYEGDPEEYLDGEMWAHGFLRGVALAAEAWAPAQADPEAAAALRVMGLLGAETLPPEDEALVETPLQRQALAERIPAAIATLHRFWRPRRNPGWPRAEALVATPRRHAAPPPGRNDACSCGSGKKFKKCCGAAT